VSGTDPKGKPLGKDGENPEHSLPKDLPKIPGITLHYEIARGGMGVVYSGRQDFLDRRVAVKFLSMDLGGDAFAQRFHREAKILAGISHPNIVGCHMADTTPEGQSYLVMEFCDGPSLKAWVSENGPVELLAALRLIRVSAMALSHAYQSDIIHRDIKTENILLEPVTSTALDIGFPYAPKIVDLGLARITHEEVGAGLTSPGAVMGTPSTMSPEQFDDPDSVDFRSDIYGLGCCLYEMLVGQPAFRGTKLTDIVLRKRDSSPPNPCEENESLPVAVGAFTQRLLASSRDDRPASYKELDKEVNELLTALMSHSSKQPIAGGASDQTIVSAPGRHRPATAATAATASGGLDATMPAGGNPAAGSRPNIQHGTTKALPQGGGSSDSGVQGTASINPMASAGVAAAGSKKGLFIGLAAIVVIAAVLVFRNSNLFSGPNTAPTITSLKRLDGEEQVDDATINLGQSLTLIAVANDAEDDELTYKWSWPREVMTSSVEPGQSEIQLKLIDGLPGVEFVVNLVVSDTDGDRDTDSFTVTVGDCRETMTIVGASRLWLKDSGRWTEKMDPRKPGVTGRLSRKPVADELAVLSNPLKSDSYWQWEGTLTPDLDSTREGDPLAYVAVRFGDAGKAKGYAVSCARSNDERDWAVELLELIPGQEKWRPHSPSTKVTWTQPTGDDSDIRGWFSLRRLGDQLVLEVGEFTQPPPVSGKPMEEPTITPRSKVVVDLNADDCEALTTGGRLQLIVSNGLCVFRGVRR
jgi:serine/threonine protein kinase